MSKITLFLVLFVAVWLQGCHRQEDISFLERLAQDPTPVFRGGAVSEETMEVVRQVLRERREQIDNNVEQTAELGQLYKSVALNYLEIGLAKQAIIERLDRSEPVPPGRSPLDVGAYHTATALRYLDSKIYREALVHLERAIEIFPDNEILYYNSGVASAHLAKATPGIDGSADRQVWFRRAEEYYRRAIELHPRYVDAQYGLAVLLFYEMDRITDAEEVLLGILEIESGNADAMFVLAAVYYQMGRLRDAVNLYETIEESTRSKDIKDAARANKQRVGGEIGDIR